MNRENGTGGGQMVPYGTDPGAHGEHNFGHKRKRRRRPQGNPSKLAPFLNSGGLLGEDEVMRMSDNQLYGEYCKYAKHTAKGWSDFGSQLVGVAGGLAEMLGLIAAGIAGIFACVVGGAMDEIFGP